MKAKPRKRRRQPLAVKRGNVTVKIYAGQNRVGDRIYPQFTLVYYDGSQRRKQRFADPEEARREAAFVAAKLASGENQALHLTATDRVVYLQALDLLRPLNVPLNFAVGEYVSAVRCLPEGATLKEAVDSFRRRTPAALEKRTVRQVVDEMLAAKRAAHLSEVHLKDLQSRLGRFAADFQMNISGVSTVMLQGWLDAMNSAGRTKRNYLMAVGALFRFAAGRKYLPKDALEEIEAVQQAKEDHGEIEIFTAAEIRELLGASRPEMIPWLAIAGFAGLRSAELTRLDWREVNLTERHIEIKASKAKTAARRLAPVSDNLAAWLAPHAKPFGPILTFDSWWNQVPKLVDEVNRLRRERGQPGTFVWKHNGLRHSFCSYRLAAIKNAAQVALEAGNSPQMIFAHYRQLVTEAEAVKWFSILPAAESNVIPMPAAAAGCDASLTNVRAHTSGDAAAN